MAGQAPRGRAAPPTPDRHPPTGPHPPARRRNRRTARTPMADSHGSVGLPGGPSGLGQPHASTGQDIIEDLVEINVPPDRVKPVAGTSYTAVPVLRRQPPAAPIPAHPGAEGWVTEHVPVPVSAPGTGPGVRLHQPGCWAISGGTGATLATRRRVGGVNFRRGAARSRWSCRPRCTGCPSGG